MTPGNGKYTPVSSMSLGERRDCVAGKDINGKTTPEDGDSVPSLGGTTGADDREVDTADKIVFCGLLDGSFEAFDLGTGRSVAKCTPPSADGPLELISMDYAPAHNMLAMGSIDGTVSIFDTRSLSTPLLSFYRNAAGIEDVRFFDNLESLRVSRGIERDGSGVGLLVGPEDGQAFVADVRPEGPVVLLELEGVDCDSVRAVRVSGSDDIWTTADDGIVRRY
jgi:proteasomal ATPase-associated factor 1